MNVYTYRALSSVKHNSPRYAAKGAVLALTFSTPMKAMA